MQKLSQSLVMKGSSSVIARAASNCNFQISWKVTTVCGSDDYDIINTLRLSSRNGSELDSSSRSGQT